MISSEKSIIRNSIAVTVLTLIFTVVCLLFKLSLRPYQVFSFFYLVAAFVFGRLTLLDAYERSGSIRIVLLYLSVYLWFVLFGYFDLFFIGFGPAAGFRSVMISLVLFPVMLFVYAGLTAGLLEHIVSRFPGNISTAFAVGLPATLVSIVIVWYFSQSAFHAVESWIGLTEELCREEYGVFSLFWIFTGFLG
ncbi:MAG: hypothetical protein K6G83_04640 [Lachnospiraceae bacterium]|nr:hypothetical protein [Lachnospiraceae bacterium]